MKIMTYSQIKSAENAAVKSGDETYVSLMEKAGNSAANEILKRYNINNKRINIICGSGNNGGDGLVIAAALKAAGGFVSLIMPFGMPSTSTAEHFHDNISGIDVLEDIDPTADIFIDALFGIGLNRPIEGKAAMIINDINNINAGKIAIDIPSGVYADGGCGDVVFCADLTITFIGLKISQVLPDTSSFCGEVTLCDLGLNPKEYAYTTIDKPILRYRDKNAHKGTFGTAFMICGSYGMCGAEILAAKSAIRSGVGIVKAVVCDKNYTAFAASVPEAVTIPVPTAENGAPIIYDKTLLSGLSSSDACLVGCGLGRSDETIKILKRILEISEIPTIIDADGINSLSQDINILSKTKAPLILTPHPAEMARLCDTTTADIEHNRIRYAKNFAMEYGCVLVLKGANTIVAAPDGKLFFNTTGNPGMATAGSGDVLAGIITAFLAMGYAPLQAAKYGVYLHGEAGDKAARNLGERYMSSTDIIEGLRESYI